MGNTEKINELIGTKQFENQPIANLNDQKTCASNCSLVEMPCTTFVGLLVGLFTAIGIDSSFIKCPLRYFKCKGNVVMLNKLVSGFSVNQKLPDGSPIEKPEDMLKCSHGGILDGIIRKT
jgi:hypothetical protein